MKREELKALGLTDEQIDKVMGINGQDIEASKTKLTTATTELEALKTQLTAANTQIEDFKKLDVEGVKKAADEWKTKAEKAQADAAAQMTELRFNHALDGALTVAKAKNSKAVRALLKSDDLKLAEDGSIVGLKDQLEKIKSENDYLFESDKPALKVVVGGKTQSTTASNPFLAAVRKGAGLPEQGE